MNNERGTVIVFITFMIVVLMVMVGLGLDTGQLTYSRATGQGAVDAAALSAVSAIPTGDVAKVEQRALAYTDKNNHLDSKANPIVAGDVTLMEYNYSTQALAPATITNANAARVAMSMRSPLFLTPLLNLFGVSAPNTRDVQVSAVAVLSAIPTIPIAMFSDVCNGSTPVNDVLLRRQPEPPTGPENSCWTTFLDGSPGANDVRELFQVSNSCTGANKSADVAKGTSIRLAPGEQGSSLGEAENLFETLEPGKCWIIPVISKSSDCNGWSPVTDWAEICPTEVVKTGNPKYIKTSVKCGQTLNTQANMCFSNRLVREKSVGM